MHPFGDDLAMTPKIGGYIKLENFRKETPVMNKKNTIFLCLIGALVVLLLAVILIGRGCARDTAGTESTTDTTGLTTDDTGNTDGTGQTGTARVNGEVLTGSGPPPF